MPSSSCRRWTNPSRGRQYEIYTHRYRAAQEHFHTLEDERLLARAADLLKDIRPAEEPPAPAPPAASFATFDHGATLLRISAAVAECVEERLRVEAESEAVAEVEAICHVESAGAPGASGARGRRGLP